jgi:hypothetical protein
VSKRREPKRFSENDTEADVENLRVHVTKYLALERQEGTLHNKVLEVAEMEHIRRERRVRQATLASYILYPLGWTIALLGKLYGDGEGPELEGQENQNVAHGRSTFAEVAQFLGLHWCTSLATGPPVWSTLVCRNLPSGRLEPASQGSRRKQ